MKFNKLIQLICELKTNRAPSVAQAKYNYARNKFQSNSHNSQNRESTIHST